MSRPEHAKPEQPAADSHPETTKDGRQAKTTNSLGTLPRELLELVIATLCNHCEKFSSPDRGSLCHEAWKRIALVHLCLVSRVTRAIAQPLLYHSFSSYSSSEGSDRLLLFLCTVIERPDLAAAVRELQLYGEPGTYPDMANRHRTIEKASTAFGLTFTTEEHWWARANPSEAHPWDRGAPYELRDFFVDLLLLLTSKNLTAVELSAADKRFSGRFSLTEARQHAGSNSFADFPQLRRLMLTRYGWYRGNWKSMLELARPLMAAAANLDVLEIHDSNGLFPFSIRSLEHADILRQIRTLLFRATGYVRTLELVALMSMFDQLEALDYRSVRPLSKKKVHFGQVLPAVRLFAGSLRRLRARFVPHTRYLTSGLAVAEAAYKPLRPGALGMMRVLEVLWIDQAAFRRLGWGRWDTVVMPADESAESTLAAVLPRSIRVLFIVKVYQPSIAIDLAHLAAWAADARLPALEKVCVDTEVLPDEVDRDGIVDGFRGTGVRVLFGRFEEWDYPIYREDVFFD